MTASGQDASPTLYEWVGEREAFERLIDAFYDRVEADELLSPLFPGGVGAEHRRLALHNSQRDAHPIEHAPVPRWGWGEAAPFEG